jgi:TolA-binding protein
MNRRLPVGVLLTAAIVSLWLTGCSGSKEQEKELSSPPPPSATELMQNELLTLRTSNDSLRKDNSRLEFEKRMLVAHVAELESENNELKSKVAAMVAPPRKTPKPSPPTPISAPPVTTTIPAGSLDSYTDALESFKRREYMAAAEKFQNVLDAGAPKGYDDNCVYWIGECLYGAKRYDEAIGQFKKVSSFEWSEKKDDAQIMIANSFLAKGDRVQARAEYEQLIKLFPASPYVRRVKEKLSAH